MSVAHTAATLNANSPLTNVPVRSFSAPSSDGAKNPPRFPIALISAMPPAAAVPPSSAVGVHQKHREERDRAEKDQRQPGEQRRRSRNERRDREPRCHDEHRHTRVNDALSGGVRVHAVREHASESHEPSAPMMRPTVLLLTPSPSRMSTGAKYATPSHAQSPSR